MRIFVEDTRMIPKYSLPNSIVLYIFRDLKVSDLMILNYLIYYYYLDFWNLL